MDHFFSPRFIPSCSHHIHLCSITLHPITVHSSNVAPILVLVKDGPLFILWIYFYFYPILTSPPIPLHSLTSCVLLQLMLPPPVGWSAFLSYHIPTPICSMTLHCHLLCTSSIIAPIPMLVSDGPIFCPLYLFPFLSHSIPCLSHPVPFPCPHLLCTLSMVGFPFSFASHYPTGWSAFFVPKINLYPSPHSITSCVLLQYCSHPHSHSHSIPPHLISSHIPFPFPFLHHPHSIPSPLVHSFNCCSHSPVGWSAFLPILHSIPFPFCSDSIPSHLISFLSLPIPSPLVYSLNCCSHSPVGWSAFLPILIPSHFHSVLILFHLISFLSLPIPSPLVYSLSCCSHSPVGWSAFLPIPIPFYSIPFPFCSHFYPSHLISIPSPLVYSFNCCSHSPVGWSAFLPILIPSHFHSVLLLFHLISFHSFPSYPITSCILPQLLLSFSCRMVRFFAHSHSIPFPFCSVSIPSHFIPIPLSHYLLYTLLQLLLSFSCRMVRFFAHSHSILFHPISILFHFYSISFLSHHLLYTPSIVLPFCCQMVRIFVPILFPYHCPILILILILIPSHLISIPIPFLSHHLLSSIPSVVALILLLDGPLFCPFTFHLISIPSPLVYSFTCCSHSHVGWSAFLVPMICPHAIPIPSYLIPFPFLEKSGWSGSIYTLSRYLM